MRHEQDQSTWFTDASEHHPALRYGLVAFAGICVDPCSGAEQYSFQHPLVCGSCPLIIWVFWFGAVVFLCCWGVSFPVALSYPRSLLMLGHRHAVCNPVFSPPVFMASTNRVRLIVDGRDGHQDIIAHMGIFTHPPLRFIFWLQLILQQSLVMAIFLKHHRSILH